MLPRSIPTAPTFYAEFTPLPHCLAYIYQRGPRARYGPGFASLAIRANYNRDVVRLLIEVHEFSF